MISFKETKDTKKMLKELSNILERNQSDVIRKAIEHFFEYLTKDSKKINKHYKPLT